MTVAPGAVKSSLDGNGLYGLSHGSTAPEQLRGVDTGQRAAETRARLEGGARLKQEEERLKLAQRHQKKEYKTGQMSGKACIIAWTVMGIE